MRAEEKREAFYFWYFSAGAFHRAEQLPVGGQEQGWEGGEELPLGGNEGGKELSVGGNKGGKETEEEEEEAAEGGA